MKQKIVIKAAIFCDKCRTEALQIVAKADGVISVALEGPEKDKVVVIGDGVDAACLTNSLRKKLKHASIEVVQDVKEEKPKTEPKPKPKPESKPKPDPSCQYPPRCELYKVVCDPDPGCTIM